MTTLFSDGSLMLAAANELESVTTSLAGGVASVQAAGAAIVPPGADGASLTAAVQQKESLMEFSAKLSEGLANLSTAIPTTTIAAAQFEGEDLSSAAALATV